VSEVVIRIPFPLAFAQSLGRLEGSSHLQDVTALLEEWAVLLNPVAAARRIAPDVLAASGWEMAGRATVSTSVIRLLREAAKDAEVVAAFSQSQRFASFVENGVLEDDRAISILAALAVTASVRAAVGRESARHAKTMRAASGDGGAVGSGIASGAKAKPDPTAAEAPPLLSPLPVDLRAP